MPVILILAIVCILGAIVFFVVASLSENKTKKSLSNIPSVLNNPSDIHLSETVQSVLLKFNFNKPGSNKRVVGFFVDLGVLLFISWVIRSISHVELSWIFSVAYWLLRDIFNGQSIGKMIVGLRVIKDQEEAISPVEGIIRNIPMAIPGVAIIEYFVMLNAKDGRRLGDKFAHTRVHDLRPGWKDGYFLLLSVIIYVAAVVSGVTYCVKSEFKKSTNDQVVERASLGKEDVEAHYQMGLKYGNQGLLEEALKEFFIVISVDTASLPQDYIRETFKDSYKNIAMVYMKKNDFEKANEYLKKTLEMFPEDAWSLYYLAGNYGTAGKIKEAKEYYNRAVSLGFDMGAEDIVGDNLLPFKERRLNITYDFVLSEKTMQIEINGNPIGGDILIHDMIEALEKYALVVGYTGELTPISVELIRLEDKGEVSVEKWIVGKENPKEFWFRCDSTPPAGFPQKIMIKVSEKDWN